MSIPIQSTSLSEAYLQLKLQEQDRKKAATKKRRVHREKINELGREQVSELQKQRSKTEQASWLGFLSGLVGAAGQVLSLFSASLAPAIVKGLEGILGTIQQLFQNQAAQNATRAESLQASLQKETQLAEQETEQVQNAQAFASRLHSDWEKILELNRQTAETSLRI